MAKEKKTGDKKGKGIVISLLVTLIFGALYYYVALPPLNPQAGDFWFFLILLLAVYTVCSLIATGARVDKSNMTELPGMLKAKCKARPSPPPFFMPRLTITC